MTFWKFNGFICGIDLVLFCLCVLRAAHLLRTRYPGVIWVRMSHWSTTTMSILKAILASMCPIFNLMLLYTLLVNDTKLIEESVEETYQKHLEFMQQRKENENANMEH